MYIYSPSQTKILITLDLLRCSQMCTRLSGACWYAHAGSWVQVSPWHQAHASDVFFWAGTSAASTGLKMLKASNGETSILKSFSPGIDVTFFVRMSKWRLARLSSSLVILHSIVTSCHIMLRDVASCYVLQFSICTWWLVWWTADPYLVPWQDSGMKQIHRWKRKHSCWACFRSMTTRFSLVLLRPVSLMLNCWAMSCSQLVGAECAGSVSRWTLNIYSNATAYIGPLFAHRSCCSPLSEDQFDSFLLATNINGLLHILMAFGSSWLRFAFARPLSPELQVIIWYIPSKQCRYEQCHFINFNATVDQSHGAHICIYTHHHKPRYSLR